jgi:hypothetical protein
MRRWPSKGYNIFARVTKSLSLLIILSGYQKVGVYVGIPSFPRFDLENIRCKNTIKMSCPETIQRIQSISVEQCI